MIPAAQLIREVAEGEEPFAPFSPPPPTPVEVLYVPQGRFSPKSCNNCMLWAYEEQACDIHPLDVEVTKNHICGYWVGGIPHAWKQRSAEDTEFLPPALTGLERVPGGTACRTCRWYSGPQEGRGRCLSVRDPETIIDHSPAHVEAGGCCNRWQR